MFHEWQLTIISHTFWHFIPQNLFESLKVDTLHLMCLYIETWGKTWYTLNPYNTWKYFSRPSHISNLFSTCATFCCTCGDNVVHMWSYNRKSYFFTHTRWSSLERSVLRRKLSSSVDLLAGRIPAFWCIPPPPVLECEVTSVFDVIYILFLNPLFLMNFKTV